MVFSGRFTGFARRRQWELVGATGVVDGVGLKCVVGLKLPVRRRRVRAGILAIEGGACWRIRVGRRWCVVGEGLLGWVT